ncbi:MAG: 5-(carboxyamino)imidazole ribonucleotide mutase [Spirochaetes bacterium]|nr:5-(carboxyamino)imidazole ribonucleotide mutase [Spirochaetota bacterium]
MDISIIIGSKSDESYIKKCVQLLKEAKISHEVRILSAHRNILELVEYVKGLQDRGVKVIITAAGYAAALPGMVAALTPLPVIGVPLPTSVLNGVDSLLAIVQMPKGNPVATMGIGESGAFNAALFAKKILHN